MNLLTDEQTIEDLRIFGKRDASGIYDLYNHTHTRGGEKVLESMFRNPLSDKEAISKRGGIIEQFASLKINFPFEGALFDMAEKYLLAADEQKSQASHQTVLSEKEVSNGVIAVIELVQRFRDFVGSTEVKGINGYNQERESIVDLLIDPAFDPVHKEKSKSKLSYSAITAYDLLFRARERNKVEKLLQHMYQLDVYISVAKVAVKFNFVFPKAMAKGLCHLKLHGLYHPELKHPVSNDITLNSGQNVIFLTGANMAGKSTFLRSISVAMYVAHIGFPVAATSMEFSVMDGIYTTINLPDNLGIGASHFYAEVLRVKQVAAELQKGRSIFVVFDELFRGTNVKDAHEASVAVTLAYARKMNSMFIISSHIIEAGEELKQLSNIGFRYLPTSMNGNIPGYTYRLETGITDDRHGMIIIRNEGILDILERGKKK
jgi:DNA mismatch repair protein MutS